MLKDNLLRLNQVLAREVQKNWARSKVDLALARQQFWALFHRAQGTSKFGYLVQAAGLGGLVHGIYLIYPPAAWILGGLVVLLLGEKL
jgi:hypothetical protein